MGGYRWVLNNERRKAMEAERQRQWERAHPVPEPPFLEMVKFIGILMAIALLGAALIGVLAIVTDGTCLDWIPGTLILLFFFCICLVFNG